MKGVVLAGGTGSRMRLMYKKNVRNNFLNLQITPYGVSQRILILV